ncbi:MAG: hypothetical protein ACHQU0_00500 [Candidatus Paceibacteria bacterium]
MDEEDDFILPTDDDMKLNDGDEEEDPLTMDGFHEEGAEPESDF